MGSISSGGKSVERESEGQPSGCSSVSTAAAAAAGSCESASMPSRIDGWHPRVAMKLSAHKPAPARGAFKRSQAAGTGSVRDRQSRQRATSRPLRLEPDARRGRLSLVRPHHHIFVRPVQG
jgi:hypothetical protein